MGRLFPRCTKVPHSLSQNASLRTGSHRKLCSVYFQVALVIDGSLYREADAAFEMHAEASAADKPLGSMLNDVFVRFRRSTYS